MNIRHLKLGRCISSHMLKQILLFTSLLLGLYIFYVSLFPTPSQTVVGKRAPLFQAEYPGKPKFELKDQIGKKVILINIWATWCETCREEIPLLNNMIRSLDPNKFILVSLMEDDASSNEVKLKILNRFRNKIPIEFPVYFDKDGMIADTYGTYKLPESYLIDLSGKVTYKHTGPITKWDKKDLLKKIKKLYSL